MNSIEIEKPLSISQRVGRALSFYSAAIPIFVSYKSLELSLKVRRDSLNEQVTPEQEEAMFQAIHDWGSNIISKKIQELKGFYVKTGQIISTRVDIFPEQYTSKLAMTQDALDPIPGEIIKEIVRKELLGGAELSELFSDFDEEPLGSASIAQVHKATLLDGRIVAVKVQRPGIEAKLLGDIANLKNFAKLVADSLPIDYYKIFCEIENTLFYELDFLHEAQATTKVASAVSHRPNNKPRDNIPVIIPLPVPGLVTRRVLVLEFVDGISLSKIAANLTLSNSAITAEKKLFGFKLLCALTDAYSSMIFGSGIIHGDPHPGNIFVLKDGKVALLDCGQVKQISTLQRISLAKLVIIINAWENLNNIITEKKRILSTDNTMKNEIKELESQLTQITKDLAQRVKNFGVEFKPGAGDECAAALAIVLFGNTDTVLPGGYAGEELSSNSPINQVTVFPSEFVLLGRATVMIKGIANRLGLSWSLSDRWAAVAEEAVSGLLNPQELLPIWSAVVPTVATTSKSSMMMKKGMTGERIRFTDVKDGFYSWIMILKKYLVDKTIKIALKFIPKKVIDKFISLYAKSISKKTT
eukprot:gene10023-13479_t